MHTHILTHRASSHGIDRNVNRVEQDKLQTGRRVSQHRESHALMTIIICCTFTSGKNRHSLGFVFYPNTRVKSSFDLSFNIIISH